MASLLRLAEAHESAVEVDVKDDAEEPMWVVEMREQVAKLKAGEDIPHTRAIIKQLERKLSWFDVQDPEVRTYETLVTRVRGQNQVIERLRDEIRMQKSRQTQFKKELKALLQKVAEFVEKL